MKTLNSLKLALGTLILMFVFSQEITAQTYTLDKATSSVKVDGTSNIHDGLFGLLDSEKSLVKLQN